MAVPVRRIIPRPPVIRDRGAQRERLWGWPLGSTAPTRSPRIATPRLAWTPMQRSSRLAAVPISLHCWQGDDVEGFEKFGTGLGGGLAATGNYPGKARTPDDLRSDATLALALIPGTHRFNLHASLRRVRRQGRRPRCGRPGALCRLDRLGQGAGDRPRLQPDLLFTSQSGRQHHAVERRSGDPHVLDQPRHRLPAHRRGDGQGARQGLHHQPVDSRRHEGLADRPRRAARTADRIPGRHLQGTNQPLAQPRLGRGQTLRNRV